MCPTVTSARDQVADIAEGARVDAHRFVKSKIMIVETAAGLVDDEQIILLDVKHYHRHVISPLQD